MIRHAVGDLTGIAMPASLAALREAPEAFLTRAMQAYGTLEAGNSIASVDRITPFAGGNSGHKALIDVTYARADDALPRHLFAKFSRDFEDPFRDRRRGELEGEVRIGALSRLADFPVAVPRTMFGDFEAASGTGLLICERIAFGEGGIEPLHEKCMDHLLPDPLPYYRALVSAQARLAAAQYRDPFRREVRMLFPHDADAIRADLPIGFGAPELIGRVRELCRFLILHPQLFPAPLAARDFGPWLEAQALAILAREDDVRGFLSDDPRLIAVCHWNANMDNAWFWRGEDGTLRCGLLDWGMVRPMNVATGLWGGLSAAGTAFLTERLDQLLGHYRAELAAQGGPAIPAGTLRDHFNLSLALTGLALMLDLPALVAARMPDIGAASGPHDPLLRRDKVVEGFLLVTTNFLTLWKRRSFAESLRAVSGA